ncbi:MAG: ABC transporter ATP-binding protein/permease [Firmicutes bacterium]|nr:ABC transporter ATP-binding protein/permease [Bacillota bacterium]
MSMIRLENVSKYYKSEETVSVGMKKVNLEFDLGEFVAVTGESGSGKSTLLNVISGLDGYEDGELYLFGEETSHFTIADWEKYRGTNIGFVFQNYNIIDSFTVLQNVLLALEVQGYDPKTRKQRALELIEKVGLTSHKNHKASKLSGGQKQRTVIARALAKDCPIIVADEPTGNLDSQSGAQVLKVLHDISKDKLIIVVTHDYDQIKEFATRKIKMHDGEVVEDKKYKKVQDVKEYVAPVPQKMSIATLIRFTFRSLFSTPKRLIFLTLLQMIVMVAFTLSYSWREGQIRDINVQQSNRFPNVPVTRLLVERRDGVDFDADDLEYFENIRFVSKVYEHGLSFYNSLRLYVFTSDNIYDTGTEKYYNSWESVSGTDAASTLSSLDIDGTLPTLANEIVIGHNWTNYNIGDDVYIGTSSQYTNPNINEDFVGKFKITGIDKAKANILYFSDAFLENPDIEQYSIDGTAKNSLIDQVSWGMTFLYNDQSMELSRGMTDQSGIAIVFNVYESGTPELIEIKDLEFSRYIYNPNTWESVEFTVTVPNVSIYKLGDEITPFGAMSEGLATYLEDYILDEFEHFYKVENRKVLSLSVKGINDGNKAIDAIDQDIYRVIYPANIPNPAAGILSFVMGLFTGIFIILFGLLLYSIVHAVSKNIMKSRKKDFAIFRSIGTNKVTLARLVVLEQVFIAAISTVLMFTVLFILSNYVTSIYEIIQFMEISDYVILVIVFLLFGAWLGLRFNKKIFRQSVIESIVSSREE